MGPHIAKGSRITASWFTAKTSPPSCLTGLMMKSGATGYDVTGTCRHFRGDDPVTPKAIVVYIDPDPGTWDGPLVKPVGCTCAVGHVAVNPDHIVAVL